MLPNFKLSGRGVYAVEGLAYPLRCYCTNPHLVAAQRIIHGQGSLFLPCPSCIQHQLRLYHRYHLQTDNTRRPRRCASSYPSLSVADTPYPTMAWQRLWRSLERMTESHRQQEDRTGFPDSRAKTNMNTLKLSDLPPELTILIASMAFDTIRCMSFSFQPSYEPNPWSRYLALLEPSKSRNAYFLPL